MQHYRYLRGHICSILQLFLIYERRKSCIFNYTVDACRVKLQSEFSLFFPFFTCASGHRLGFRNRHEWLMFKCNNTKAQQVINHLFGKFTLPIKWSERLIQETTKTKVRWNSSFLNLSFKKKSVFYKGPHGSSPTRFGSVWGLCYNRWVVLIFYLFGLGGWEPESSPCPNIQIIIREGLVMGGLKPMSSHRR